MDSFEGGQRHVWQQNASKSFSISSVVLSSPSVLFGSKRSAPATLLLMGAGRGGIRSSSVDSGAGSTGVRCTRRRLGRLENSPPCERAISLFNRKDSHPSSISNLLLLYDSLAVVVCVFPLFLCRRDCYVHNSRLGCVWEPPDVKLALRARLLLMT